MTSNDGSAETEGPPTTVGPFRIESEVLRTGSSVNYIACKPGDAVKVFLKVLEEGAAPGLNADGMRLILHEAQITKILDNPGISKIVEAGIDGRFLYIATEYEPGTPLETLIGKTGRLPPIRAAEIALEVGKALAYGHGRGLFHKNLKSTNVLLTQSGRVVVADFGLARMPDPLEKIGHGLDYSTMHQFLSPEQAAGDFDRVDQRSDVYALGALMHRMLTGHDLYQKQASSALKHYQILNVPPKSPRALDRSVPRGLDAICMKALRKKPHERYWSMAEMATDIKRFLTGEPIRALQEKSAESVLGMVLRSPLTLGALFVGTAVLAVSLAMVFGAGKRAGLDHADVEQPAQIQERPDPKGFSESRAAMKEALSIPVSRENLQNKVSLFEKATQADPCNRRAWAHLGYALMLFGRLPQAIDALGRTGPDLGSAFPRYLWGFVNYEFAINEQAALREFKSGSDLVEKSAYPLLCRAWALWLDGRNRKEALETLRQADVAAALPWESNYLRGIILSESQPANFRGARLAFTRATEALGGFGPALARRAMTNLDLGERRMAEEDIAAALEIDPANARALHFRGTILIFEGRHEEAIRDFERATESAPLFWPAYNAIGACLIALGKHSDAIMPLSKAIELNPGNHEALMKRGQAHFETGKHQDAESDYRRAAAAAPYLSEPRHCLGLFLLAMARMREALAAFSDAIRLDPAGAGHYIQRAEVHYATGDFESARIDFEQALTKDPSDPIPYFKAAYILYVHENNTEIAIEHIKSGLRCCPVNPIRKEMEDLLRQMEKGTGK